MHNFISLLIAISLILPYASAVDATPLQDKVMGVTVSVAHVDGDSSSIPQQDIIDALIESYNKVYPAKGKNGREAKRVLVEQIVTVPENDSLYLESRHGTVSHSSSLTWMLMRGFFWTGCYLCPDDDWAWPDDDDWKRVPLPAPVNPAWKVRASSTPAHADDNGSLRKNRSKHRAMEAAFCSELRKSGTVFQNAKDCRITFQMAAAEDAAATTDVVQAAAAPAVDLGLEITTYSVSKKQHADVTATNIVLGQALVDVYNDLHRDSQLVEAHLMSELDLADDTNGNIVDRIHTFGITMSQQAVLASVQPRLMEVMVCEKLRNSGLSGYESVADCRIIFDFRSSTKTSTAPVETPETQ